jgi:hypothetical protein
MKIRRASTADFKHLLDLLVESEKVYFVADHKGGLIGFTCVNKNESTPDIGWIGEIFVKVKFRWGEIQS